MCRLHTEVGHVLHREESAFALNEPDDFLCDFTLVEEIAGRLKRRLPALYGVVALDLNQPLESAGQVFLHQDIANVGTATAGKKTAAVEGHRPSPSESPMRESPVRASADCSVAGMGNPPSASSSAGVTTCSKDMLP